MFDNNKAGWKLLAGIITTFVIVLLFTGMQMSLVRRSSLVFYQFVEDDMDAEDDAGGGEEDRRDESVYISPEGSASTDEKVDINSEKENAFGGEVYINQETNYRVLLEDDAGLLEENEKRELAAVMEGITAYGNVIFKTADSGIFNTASYAGVYYREKIGTDSGILFLIDMDNRMLWIHCDGAVYRVITKAYADMITDNVYRYATGGDYYTCAAQAYGQALTLLEGNRIARPMKYISNALLAMILAMLLNYGLVCLSARIGKPRRRELLGNAGNYFRYTEPQAYFRRESRTYHPTSSGGSGRNSSGSRRSSSGSRSSGSRRSGGGGGHRF